MRSIEEKLLFLYKFARAPKQTGSVTPSSVFLAEKMIGAVPWHEVEYAAELGAGTGAITRFMKKRIDSSTKVVLFEKDRFLREQLASKFQDYTCYEDACNLQSILQKEGIAQLDCILSGLPFFNFPQSLRKQLMNQIAGSLKPGGLFIAFQYSQQMRKQFSSQFEIEHIHFVPFNFPPAFVYVCRKSQEQFVEACNYEL
ncbi:phospholipid methyltransferase [Paenibacillus sp. LMG 31457]|uniref:Phospholipid methyltransferase n=2 Tax=Paenibacillus planticolens TaxID=2654976 RepID=A0ABX1ZHR7_9BACL|nr:phospholipid methyltransferase [Paenibacillus planticolens]NOU98532.1 phospholipid methyltransferase [Paenibacillus planticolens]